MAFPRRPKMRMRAPRRSRNPGGFICFSEVENLKLDETRLFFQPIIISNSPTSLDLSILHNQCVQTLILWSSPKTEMKCTKCQCTNENTKMTGHTEKRRKEWSTIFLQLWRSCQAPQRRPLLKPPRHAVWLVSNDCTRCSNTLLL